MDLCFTFSMEMSLKVDQVSVLSLLKKSLIKEFSLEFI